MSDRYWYMCTSFAKKDRDEELPSIELRGVNRVVRFQDVLPHLKLDGHFKPQVPGSSLLKGTCPIPWWGITNPRKALRENEARREQDRDHPPSPLPHLTLNGRLHIVCGHDAYIDLDAQRYYCDCLAPERWGPDRFPDYGVQRPLRVVRFVQLITGIRDRPTLRAWFVKRFKVPRPRGRPVNRVPHGTQG